VTFPPVPQPNLALDLATREGCKAESAMQLMRSSYPRLHIAAAVAINTTKNVTLIVSASYDCTVTATSTQPCIPPGSLNRVPASAGVRAGMSPLPGGR